MTIFIIILMLIFNAIFAAYEMALASIPRSRISVFLNQKKKGAVEASYMKDNMEASLAVIQLGITLVGACAASFGGAGVQESFAPYLQKIFSLSETFSELLALIFLIIPLSIFTILFGELIPKMFALNNKEWVVLKLSSPMKTLSLLTYPVVLVFETIVKYVVLKGSKTIKSPEPSDAHSLHELMAAAALARSSKLLGAREEKIVLAAAGLSTRPVKDIVISNSEIFMLCTQHTLSDAIIKAHMDMHTRFPITTEDNNPQSIVGYVNFKDVVTALKVNPEDPSLKGIARPIKKIQGTLPISQALESMMQEKAHIALVLMDQEVIGMITLEDIIEELVGDIEDEFDKLPTYLHTQENYAVVGGGITMDTLLRYFGKEWPEKGNGKKTTLAEWVSKKLDTDLKGGEIIESDGLRVLVRKLRRKKLAEAIVTVLAK